MTMTARSAVFALLALAAPVLSGPAQAQTAPQPPAEASRAELPAGPRFAFAPAEGGTLMLDTATGRVSLCAKGPSGFACTAVPDTRDAYEAEIARLQAEIATLKQGTPPPADLPTASDVDKAFDYAAHLYRRLRQMIDQLAGPDQSETL